MFVQNDKIEITYLILFKKITFYLIRVTLERNQLRIADLNTKHVTHSKSAIRNLQSEILST